MSELTKIQTSRLKTEEDEANYILEAKNTFRIYSKSLSILNRRIIKNKYFI